MLTHPSFTIVPSFDESHVLFAASPVSGFFGLAQRMVNQFPHEQCLVNPRFFMNTVRLSAQPRHSGRVTDQNQQAQSLPSWFPLMFDMKTEVNHFLAEYARRCKSGKENFWLLFSGGKESSSVHICASYYAVSNKIQYSTSWYLGVITWGALLPVTYAWVCLVYWATYNRIANSASANCW